MCYRVLDVEEQAHLPGRSVPQKRYRTLAEIQGLNAWINAETAKGMKKKVVLANLGIGKTTYYNFLRRLEAAAAKEKGPGSTTAKAS